MTQPPRDLSRPRPPEGGGHGRRPATQTGAAAAAVGRCGRCGDAVSPAGSSLLHRLGCVWTWFRSGEGPPPTPEEEAERWRLLFGCGF
jgi:hypothetical protein